LSYDEELQMVTLMPWHVDESREAPPAMAFSATATLPAEATSAFRDGMNYLQMGEGHKAVTMLTRAIEHAPDFSAGHAFLGVAHALTNSIYPALDHLECATKLEPDNFAAHFLLAQLNFKLRIPQKGYLEAEQALRCVRTLEQRKMLTQLLAGERARERNGIARPWFNKPFNASALLVAGSGLAAAIMAIFAHIH
jgi:tetratricopeptide (TPR) repeat protein